MTTSEQAGTVVGEDGREFREFSVEEIVPGFTITLPGNHSGRIPYPITVTRHYREFKGFRQFTFDDGLQREWPLTYTFWGYTNNRPSLN